MFERNQDRRQSWLVPVVVAAIAAVPPTILAYSALIAAHDTAHSVDGLTHEFTAASVAKATAEATLKEKAAEAQRKGEAAETKQASKSTVR